MIKLFTHTDFDGVGCSVLMQLAFGKNNMDISYCDYDNIDLEVQKYLMKENDHTIPIFITDISVNEETAKLLDKRTMVKLLDHHPTALWLNKYLWCTIVIEFETLESGIIKTSGTELLYHLLIKNEYLEDTKALKNFVQVVRDYDTWRWSTFGANGIICKQINDLLYLYGRDNFIDWCLSEIYDGVFPELYPKEKTVLKIKQNEIDRYVEEKDKTMIMSPMYGKLCGFVFADRYISELGNRLCQKHPEIDYVAMIDIDNCTVSYRTIKADIDLGKDVASLFGGGGHPKAAGSKFSQEIKLKVTRDIFANEGENK